MILFFNMSHSVWSVSNDVSDGSLPSLSTPKPNTSLRMLENVKNLQFSDLEIEDVATVKRSAPNFTAEDHLYTNLIDIDNVVVPCPLERKEFPRVHPKKDPVPNPKQYLIYPSIEIEPFHHVMRPNFPEMPPDFGARSLYKKRREWKL